MKRRSQGNRFSRHALSVMLAFTLSLALSIGHSTLAANPENADFLDQRAAMVETQIKRRGITDDRVLRSMMSVLRHKFVSDRYVGAAYDDSPLPIGYGQTISQPYIVAYMTEVLNLNKTSKVLEVGTGSGYQAAVLSPIVKKDQLKKNGRMVIPVGGAFMFQNLVMIMKDQHGLITTRNLMPVRFVPLTGKRD
ncbi:MAG: protein-L-isoaspartate O-methyltransferase [Deltaproteobacteria bacterium]|nr:protein-L-isoaspartate O-methyltransferase [Deltaproteobacteria bacterium]